jgi:hypothetical protein
MSDTKSVAFRGTLTCVHIDHDNSSAWESRKAKLLKLAGVRAVVEGGLVSGTDRHVAAIIPRSTNDIRTILDCLRAAGVRIESIGD